MDSSRVAVRLSAPQDALHQARQQLVTLLAARVRQLTSVPAPRRRKPFNHRFAKPDRSPSSGVPTSRTLVRRSRRRRGRAPMWFIEIPGRVATDRFMLAHEHGVLFASDGTVRVFKALPPGQRVTWQVPGRG
jgi:hypothetical protein